MPCPVKLWRMRIAPLFLLAMLLSVAITSGQDSNTNTPTKPGKSAPVPPPPDVTTPVANFTGHYELDGAHPGRVFSLDVNQTGNNADITFSAAMTDGSGQAPDGDGKGRWRDGILNFKLTDSFGNEVTCVLELGPKGYYLKMTLTKLTDPGPIHFYGNVLLKKTSDKTSG